MMEESTEEADEAWKRMQAEDERLGLQVIEQITRAFAGVERGNGVSLHQAEEIDAYEGEAAQMAARMLDTDVRWQDVPDSDIAQHYSIHPFLDAEGFRYYAPAYMVWSIRYTYTDTYADTNSVSSEFTVYAFDLSDKPDIRAWQMDKWSLFNDEQRCAICAFLRLMQKEYAGNDAERALNAYWGQFC